MFCMSFYSMLNLSQGALSYKIDAKPRSLKEAG